MTNLPLRRASGLLLLVLGTIGDPGAASAQTQSVVVYVEGPESEAVRNITLDALPKGIALADEGEFRAQLVREGQSRPIGKDLDPAVIDRVRRVARIMGVAAAVVVRVRRYQKGHQLLLLVVPAWKTPASAEERTLALTSRADDVAEVASVLGPTLQPYVPEPPSPPASPPASLPPPETPVPTPPPPAPVPTERRPIEASPEIRPPRTPAQIAATSVVDIALASGVEGRRFDYRSGIVPTADRSTIFPAPAVGVRGQLFPLARAGGPWGDIGIVATYTRIFSEMNDTGTLAANFAPSSCSAGVRARIHPAAQPRLVVGVSLQYTFTSRRAVGPPQYELPDVTYRSLRPSIDARVSFGRFSLLEEVAFRAPLDTQAISTRFYAPKGQGLDAALGGALMFTPSIEARLLANYEMHRFAFTPPPGATFGAGDARDQLYGAELAIALVF
jgi:hypothetical protein